MKTLNLAGKNLEFFGKQVPSEGTAEVVRQLVATPAGKMWDEKLSHKTKGYTFVLVPIEVAKSLPENKHLVGVDFSTGEPVFSFNTKTVWVYQCEHFTCSYDEDGEEVEETEWYTGWDFSDDWEETNPSEEEWKEFEQDKRRIGERSGIRFTNRRQKTLIWAFQKNAKFIPPLHAETNM